MPSYKDEIVRSMDILAKNPKTIFIGQSVKWPGTGLYWTIKNIPEQKRIELPVFEDTQMGISTGLSLSGMIPISIYPRLDFLILAINQLINHLDKFEEMSDGQFKPKVIIRTALGSVKPLFPGPQHCGDYRIALESMCKNIKVITLSEKTMIVPTYENALTSSISTIIIELPDLYET